MSTQNVKNGNNKKGLSHLYASFLYSLDGFKAAFHNEVAFRQELFIVVLGIVISFFLPVSLVEQILLVGCLLLLLIVELLNSAIEAVVDRISAELNPLSKIAKDLGSAAVFVTVLLCLFTWSLILWHCFMK